MKRISPLCSIVLITYNGKDLLSKYIQSIVNLSYPNKEIIVVDNASTDGTDEFLTGNFPEVKVIKVRNNEGTAEGSNIGASAANGAFIFFLHNDMYLETDTLDRLIKKISSSDRIAICTCKVKKMNVDGATLNIIDSVGGGLDRYGFPVARGITEVDRSQYDHIEQTFFAFGGPLLIRKNVFHELGGMDSMTFTLADDIDLCWRCRLLGYDVIVDTNTVIYHRLSGTLNSFARENKRYLSERNTLRMLIKNYSALSLLHILPVYCAILFSEVLFFILVKKYRLALSDMRAFYWNVKNLGDTLKERKRVQKARKIPDKEIFSHMIKSSIKLAYFRQFITNRKDPAWVAYLNDK
jgi:GT2 family glycosyltransferase